MYGVGINGGKPMLKNITEEERLEMREKAKINRDAKKLAGESLRQNYVDENYHRELYSKFGLRMPIAYISNKELKHLRRAIKHLGVDVKEYLEYCGVGSLKKLVDMNPTTTAREEVGLLLEYWNEKQQGVEG